MNGKMKNNFGRILAIVLAVAMVVVMMPANSMVSKAAGFELQVNASQTVECKVGDTDVLDVTSVFNGQMVNGIMSFATSDASVVTIDPATGQYECIAAGTAYITIVSDYTDPDTSTDYSDSQKLKFVVANADVPAPSVTVDYAGGITSDVAMDAGEVKNFADLVTVTNGDAKNLIWTSNDSEVVNITNGMAVAGKAGKAVVKAETVDGDFVLFVVEVSEVAQTVVDIALNAPDNFEIVKDDTKDLSAIIDLTPATSPKEDVVWTSSDESVATVAEGGVLLAVNPGIAIIKAETVSGKYVNIIAKVVAPTVTNAKVDYDTAAEKTVTLDAGDTKDLTSSVVVTDGTLGDVVWTSDNTGVATVTNGIVNAKKGGNAVITAATSETSISFTIVVKDVVIKSVESSVSEVELSIKETPSASFNLDSVLTVKNAAIADLTYTLSDNTGVTVSAGQDSIEFTNAGTYILKASIDDSYVSIVFHVVGKTEQEVIDGITVSGGAAKEYNAVGEVYDIIADGDITVTDNAYSKITWTTSDANVASVSMGTVVTTGEGTAIITATAPNGTYVNYTITVKLPKLSAAVDSFDVDLKTSAASTYDLASLIKVENENPINLVYTDFDTSIVNVSTAGVVSFVGNTGTTYVTASLGTLSVTFRFNVIDTTEPDPIKIDYDTSAVKVIELDEGVVYADDLNSYVVVTNGEAKDVSWSTDNAAVATISDGILTAVAPGTAVITASTKDGYYVIFMVKVNKLAQVVDYDASAVKSIQLKAGEVYADNLNDYLQLTNCEIKDITWTVDNTFVATVSEGILTAVAPGTAVATASTKDGYKVTFAIKVDADPMTIDYDTSAVKDITIKAGEVYATNLKDYVVLSKGEMKDVTWTSNNEAVATISEGTLTGVKDGTAVIKAETVDGYYVTFNITVNADDMIIDYDTSAVKDITIKAGEVYATNLKDYVTLSKGEMKDVTWTTDNAAVATISEGTLTGVEEGTAVIKAETVDGYYVTFNITVQPDKMIIDYDTSAVKDITIKAGEVYATNLKDYVTLTKGDMKDVTWTTDNAAIATISEGTLTGVKEGTAVVKATTIDNYYVTFNITVKADPMTIDYDTSAVKDIKIKSGEVYATNLKDYVTINKGEMKDVTWTVDKADVATISDGTLTGVKAGTAVVKATTVDNYYVTFNITVTPVKVAYDSSAVTEIVLTEGDVYAANLEDYIVITDGESKDITWSVDNASVATITGGVLTAVKEGTAVVTAATKDGYSVTFRIVVKAPVLADVAVKSGENNIVNLVVDSATDSIDVVPRLESTKIPSSDISKFTWVSNDPSVAMVVNGNIKAVGVGLTTVTVTAPDGTVVEFVVTVSAGTLAATPAWEAVLQIGATEFKTLPAVTSTAGEITWSVADPTIAEIVATTVVALSPGTTYAVATAPDGSKISYLVTVYDGVKLTFEKVNTTVVMGETAESKLTIKPADATPVYTVTVDGAAAVDGTDYIMTLNDGGISFIPLKAGRFIITASATVNELSASTKWTVKALQDVTNIEFTQTELTLYVPQTEDLEALIKWNDGLSTPFNESITWTTGNEKVCTVDASGVLTATGIGTTYVYATSYNNMRARIKVVIKQVPSAVVINKDSYELWVGETDEIIAVPDPEKASIDSIVYSSENTSIASVDANGNIKALAGGNTKIVATINYKDENGTSKSINAKATILVKAPVTKVDIVRGDTFNKDTINTNVIGKEIQLNAVITPANAYDKTVQWASGDDSIATVDANGRVVAVSKGETYITATCVSGGYGTDGTGTPATDRIKIVVGGDKVSIGITPERSEVYPGESIQFEPVLAGDIIDGSLVWEASSTDITIDSKGVGKVSETAPKGTITVTAKMTMADGNVYTADALVYVKTDVTSVKFASDKKTVYIFEDFDLSPIFNDGASEPDNKSLTWMATDESVLTVDQYGKVSPKGVGSSWVYATAYNKLRAEIYVTVIAAPKEITLSREKMTMWNGDKAKISYTFSPEYTTEKDVKWTTTNAAVAYYDVKEARIVAVGGGECEITVTAVDTHHGTISDSVKVTVKQSPTGIEINKKSVSKREGDYFQLKATVLPDNATNKIVFWTSSNPKVATVDEFGMVTCLKKGKTVITAVSKNGLVDTCKVTVKLPKPFPGVVSVDHLYVRDSASLQGLQLGMFNKGKKVTIVETIGEWYKIKYKKGVKGYAYVRSAYVDAKNKTPLNITGIPSNGALNSTTWVYTGVGSGANTQAPTGTRVLIMDKVGGYYKIKYGTNSLASGYVVASKVTPDAKFKYGVATKVVPLSTESKKESSTPRVTTYKVFKTLTSAIIYADATGNGKKLGRVTKSAKITINSQNINGYYQVVFTNGVIGYVNVKKVKYMYKRTKSNVNKTDTFTKMK